MANTFVDDTADAGQTDFLFNFPYLEDEHVAVFIDGVRQTIGVDEDYTVQTSPSKRIVLNAAATGGEIVRVRRISDPATDLVDFVNGSVLTESELDRSYLHNRYLAEESAEQNDISLRVKAGSDGQFDALNKKIINVIDPTADQDAATKNYVDGVVGNVAVGALPDNSVTYGKIQEAAGNNVLLGNDNGANSDIQELSAAEAKTLLGLSTVATSGSYNDLSDKPTPTAPVPTGSVTAFAGSAAPTGYVLCDGSEYSETTEAALFAVISTTYNTGGETANHFRVPDLRGRVVAGLDSADNVLNDTSSIDGTALGEVGGDDVHTLTVAEMPSHSHGYTVPTYGFGVSGGGSQYSGNSASGTTSATGGGQAHNNVQPTIILNYIIKT